MKRYFLILMVCSIFCTSLASADGGDGGGSVGTRGGGDVVFQNGHPALRDLYDRTVCEWRNLSDLMHASAAMSRLLTNIESKNPYLAFELRKLAEDLNVCFTRGKLKPFPSEDLKHITVYREKTQQIAVRFDSLIYVDQNLFEKLPAREQALLYAHEISHSLISMDTEGRTAKLRSFVQMLGQIEGLSTRDVIANLTGNEVQSGWISPENWPTVYSFLGSNRAPIFRRESLFKFILSSFENLSPMSRCFVYYNDRGKIDFSESSALKAFYRSLPSQDGPRSRLNADDEKEIASMLSQVSCEVFKY